MKECCVRCGKETQYLIDELITVRLYYVEDSGQLCERCWKKLYTKVADVMKSFFLSADVATADRKTNWEHVSAVENW